MTVALIYRILVLLFLVFHKLRIKQTARFGNPFGLQTSLVFYGLVLQRTLLLYFFFLPKIPPDSGTGSFMALAYSRRASFWLWLRFFGTEMFTVT